MKGNPKIIDTLNKLLANELAAINQYMVHSGMCGNWGYTVLDDTIQNRAKDEMKHAHRLIDRILFLGGTPIVNNLDPITIGAFVPDMHNNDHSAEITAIQGYNDAIALCSDYGDNDTRTLLEDNLNDETRHIDWIESQITQIEQIGVPDYLAQQIYD